MSNLGQYRKALCLVCKAPVEPTRLLCTICVRDRKPVERKDDAGDENPKDAP